MSAHLRARELLLLLLLPHRRLDGRRERSPSLTPTFVENLKAEQITDTDTLQALLFLYEQRVDCDNIFCGYLVLK